MLGTNPYLRTELIEEREYQVNISRKCIERNTLVVLPTSIGKTMIALIVIADFLAKTGASPEKKVLFLATTKPLVVQQYEHGVLKFINIEKEKVALFTGEVPWKKRKSIWEKSVIVVSTPQVIVNDLLANRISIENFGLVIFDEAHKGVGNYDYVHIGKLCKEHHIRTMGLTASPGAKKEKVLEVCENLNINWAEIRLETDRDVVPYVHGFISHREYVVLPPEIERISRNIKEAMMEYIEGLKKFGISLTLKGLTFTRFEEVMGRIKARIAQKKEGSLYAAMSYLAALQKLHYALQLVETQGVRQFLAYYQNKLLPDAQEADASKASVKVAKHPKILEAVLRAKECKVEHPKILKIREIIERQFAEKPDSRILVFADVRESIAYIYENIKTIPGVRPSLFYGQASKKTSKGMRQKQQIEIIEKFRKGEFNVLCATSVAEEGLDIPSMDMVIFYEPVGSEKRLIQRRGRTGRRYTGKVYFLVTVDSYDMGRLFASTKKELKMRRIVKEVQNEFLKAEAKRKAEEEKQEKCAGDQVMKEVPHVEEKKAVETGKRQLTLDDFFGATCEKPPEIIVDRREFRSEIHRELSRLGVHVIFKVLEVGDYLISDEVIVERKTVDDFVNSILDGRIFEQAKALCETNAHPLMVVEGKWSGYTRNVPVSAVYGALCAIGIDFGIPVVNFESPQEIASFLYQTIRRVNTCSRVPRIRFEKKPKSMAELQEYLVAGLPEVSTVMSRRLLEHFKSPKKVFNATVKELMEVRGLGETKAREIHEVLNFEWRSMDEF
ncbi:MAG: helicase-related protein [Thermoplasmata archaeon]|nr:helicase-related protein [Thermoplasmata archaeon]